MNENDYLVKQITDTKSDVKELKSEFNAFKCSVMRILIQFIGGSFVVFISIIMFLIDKLMGVR